jgi:hypothetical protein
VPHARVSTSSAFGPNSCPAHAYRSHRINARVRVGYVAAKTLATCAPGPAPKITVEREPTSSRTAQTSRTCVSREGSSVARLERPVARMSWRMTRANDAARSLTERNTSCSHMTSRPPMKACSHIRSIGPSPTVWYAIDVPSAAGA